MQERIKDAETMPVEKMGWVESVKKALVPAIDETLAVEKKWADNYFLLVGAI